MRGAGPAARSFFLRFLPDIPNTVRARCDKPQCPALTVTVRGCVREPHTDEQVADPPHGEGYFFPETLLLPPLAAPVIFPPPLLPPDLDMTLLSLTLLSSLCPDHAHYQGVSLPTVCIPPPMGIGCGHALQVFTGRPDITEGAVPSPLGSRRGLRAWSARGTMTSAQQAGSVRRVRVMP